MNDRIIQFSQLGNFGRLGNQMFQYAFARAYAEKYDATLEIPNWIGEKIFKNVSHRPVSRRLPRTVIDKITWGDVNVNFFGYFQKKECYEILSESKLREWFSFQDKWLETYPKKENEVVAHLRKGDYAKVYTRNFCVISRKSYIRACRKFGLDSQKIVWLSEETPTKDDAAVEVSYKKTKNSMYGSGMYEDNGVSFLPDFFRMINARALLRANSTFSFWAGFFREGDTFSPAVDGKVGLSDVEFVRGNYSAMFPGHCNVIFGA